MADSHSAVAAGIPDAEDLVRRIRSIHARIRDDLIAAAEHSSAEALAAVAADEAGDTLFALDRITEANLLDLFSDLAREYPCVLIAEGLDPRGVALPAGMDADAAELRIIVDPLDGTRNLMYQKRAGWILTGVAPNRGPGTNLADIGLAVQTEVPTLKQHLCDTWWAVAGQGARGERLNRLDGTTRTLAPSPSRATTLAHGFGGIARFFPGDIAELAAIEDEVVNRILGLKAAGKAHTFNDQYASTGGQVAELIVGHDRWLADLRPLLSPRHHAAGRPLPICCHPYDICTELIARAAGVVITDAHGGPLQDALNIELNVAWVGYASEAIRRTVEPVLQAVLRERGL